MFSFHSYLVAPKMESINLPLTFCFGSDLGKLSPLTRRYSREFSESESGIRAVLNVHFLHVGCLSEERKPSGKILWE